MTMDWPDSTIVTRSGQLIEAEVDGELVGLNVETGTCYAFSSTATDVWRWLIAARTIGELRDRLESAYDVSSSQCDLELRELLMRLETEGIVRLNTLPPGEDQQRD